jgi:hypothetical protein
MPAQKFSYNHRLSVWRDYRLEMHCCRCDQRTTGMEVAALIRWHGDKTFEEIVRRLCCGFCRRRPTFLALTSNASSTAAEKHGARWCLILTDECATA